MKTWEKWYWGTIIVLLFIPLTIILVSGEKGVRWEKTVNDVTTIGYWSKTKAFGYLIGIPLAVAFGTWLLIKVILWLMRDK
ncbi:MAG: hypothetical protein MRERC_2c017 [Mycoplasmataceae bacterium RC_NB112A]|nr:MAG: hypothetical protein MRERC_6c084 [Mycoplasmataceae bacterium RC_NB112A]KLL02143.1 MAG: hypothetical protein MRERC_4c106 [Mycoplasmataceae bacterium RC_NB112A]KLL02166.1 MAG: hypothetical protein MRERC_4c137 [Mycoplasmataceae bacterium RC_NB112A]KLL02304.1 MAG: hypothetical protein MRERC_2c017 [Mycoplasmataceae bacterium RC_NB112A]